MGDNVPRVAPVENPTQSFWQTEPHVLNDVRTSRDLPASCDVVIIGAGYAGVATAYNLVKSEDGHDLHDLKVAILEARSVCSGATGRNGKEKDILQFCISRLSKF
jgi:NADPH-dependent 2,4-dienoyl-CoA reductase/sulfur reductase-like enzyme